jgi:hypothetical protein
MPTSNTRSASLAVGEVVAGARRSRHLWSSAATSNVRAAVNDVKRRESRTATMRSSRFVRNPSAQLRTGLERKRAGGRATYTRAVLVFVLRTDAATEVAHALIGRGWTVTPEKHGAGPPHFAIALDGCVVEIYPATDERACDRCAGTIVDDRPRRSVGSVSTRCSRFTARRSRSSSVKDPT